MLCGVILAAGESTRMGRDKALLPWPPITPGTIQTDGETLLSAAIHSLLQLTDEVVVVSGNNSDTIAPFVQAYGASLVRNPAPERGQFSSIQAGLRAVLERGCNAAILTPVDCPPLSATTLLHLRTSFEQASSRGKWGVAPERDGKHGHPLFLSLELIEAFLCAPATSNTRDVKRANEEHVEYVQVSDPFAGAEVNTPEEYAALSMPASSKSR